MGIPKFRTLDAQKDLYEHIVLKKTKCFYRFVKRHPDYPELLEFVCKSCWTIKYVSLWE